MNAAPRSSSRSVIRLSRWSRQFHRWLAYGLGAIVALWVVTGVVMLFPPPRATRAPTPAPIDPSRAVHSPRDAAQALPSDAGVRGITLRNLNDRIIYDFALRSGAHVWVDATTGQRVELSDSIALALARRVMLDSSVSHSARLITQHDAVYRFGALPAYRVQLADPSRTLIHVSADGLITSTSTRSRVRAALAGLHEFQLPGGVIPPRARKALLLGASALTIILVVTGYVLSLPARWRS